MRTLHFLAMLPFLSSASCFASGIDRYLGYYSKPSTGCTNMQHEDGKCAKGFKDCMKLTKLDRKKVKVEIYTVGANMHTCNVFAIARVTGNTLAFDPDPTESALSFENVRLHLTNGGVNISHQSKKSDLFCGVHASLNNAYFPLATRKKNVKETCAEE